MIVIIIIITIVAKSLPTPEFRDPELQALVTLSAAHWLILAQAHQGVPSHTADQAEMAFSDDGAPGEEGSRFGSGPSAAQGFVAHWTSD